MTWIAIYRTDASQAGNFFRHMESIDPHYVLMDLNTNRKKNVKVSSYLYTKISKKEAEMVCGHHAKFLKVLKGKPELRDYVRVS